MRRMQLTRLQVLNADADVQRLKQRRQNLMYQVAVLQLQRVSDGMQQLKRNNLHLLSL